LQRKHSSVPMSRSPQRARFRTWFPLREWRFESSLRHSFQAKGRERFPVGWGTGERARGARELLSREPLSVGQAANSPRDGWPVGRELLRRHNSCPSSKLRHQTSRPPWPNRWPRGARVRAARRPRGPQGGGQDSLLAPPGGHSPGNRSSNGRRLDRTHHRPQ